MNFWLDINQLFITWALPLSEALSHFSSHSSLRDTFNRARLFALQRFLANIDMSELLPGLPERLKAVRERFARALSAAHRADDAAELIAVGKTFPVSAVELAWECGARAFGENYVQEGVEKIQYFREHHPEDLPVWHFIGPLQSNKTRPVAEHFDWVHSIDRLKIAQRLSDQRPEGMPPLNVLIEVNVSREDSKSGVAPEEALALAREVAALPRLKLRGFMAIPAPSTDSEARRAPFRALRELLHEAQKTLPELDTLSMGMSADMEEAILEGATFVRVGSAIFGPRDYSKTR